MVAPRGRRNLGRILNDINGFHVKPEHAFHALDTARGGAIAEGNVGGGTGMICNGFKGGTGTASRKLDAKDGGYTVGVLVQCNYGKQEQLRIAGIPVGRELPRRSILRDNDQGSIIVVVATDAPLLPQQLKRIARRVPLVWDATAATPATARATSSSPSPLRTQEPGPQRV